MESFESCAGYKREQAYKLSLNSFRDMILRQANWQPLDVASGLALWDFAWTSLELNLRRGMLRQGEWIM